MHIMKDKICEMFKIVKISHKSSKFSSNQSYYNAFLLNYLILKFSNGE